MAISVDEIQYVPPEIKGNLPEEVLKQAQGEIGFEDVWKVLVTQSLYRPSAEHQGYTVTAFYGTGGQTRDSKITA